MGAVLFRRQNLRHLPSLLYRTPSTKFDIPVVRTQKIRCLIKREKNENWCHEVRKGLEGESNFWPLESSFPLCKLLMVKGNISLGNYEFHITINLRWSGPMLLVFWKSECFSLDGELNRFHKYYVLYIWFLQKSKYRGCIVLPTCITVLHICGNSTKTFYEKLV